MTTRTLNNPLYTGVRTTTTSRENTLTNRQPNALSTPSGSGTGRYQSSFETGRSINRDYSKTYSHGDTSDLFKPSGKPIGGIWGKLLDRLPTLSKSASFDKSAAIWSRSGQFNKLGGLAQGQGSISLGEVYARGKGNVSFKGGALTASGDVQAGATLVNAQGSVRFGKGDYFLDAKGSAYVGAKASAGGELTIDPRRGIYAARVGGEAFAGARVGAEANLNLGKFGSAGGRAEAWAGVGASFKAEAGFKDGRFKARVDIGAALGIGFKLGFNVDINVKGIKDAVVNVVKKPIEAVKKVGEKIGNFFKKLF
jgi:hypothetical protein